MRRDSRIAALVVARELDAAEPILRELRRLSYIAVWLDSTNSALQMIDVVDFEVVALVIEDAADWDSCRRIAHSARCPVAVVSRLLAPDHRYRRRAFRMGAAAYICPGATRATVRALLQRLNRGDRRIDLTQGAPYYCS